MTALFCKRGGFKKIMYVTFISPKYANLDVYIPSIRKFITFHEGLYSTGNEEIIREIRKLIETGKVDYRELKTRNIKSGEPMKIMLQRMGGIGDILFTTPIAKHLKKLGHTISYHVCFDFAELLQHNPYVDNIYVNKEFFDLQKLPDGFGKPMIEIDDVLPDDIMLPNPLTEDAAKSHDRLITFNGAIEQNPIAEKEHAIDACISWAGFNPEEITDKSLILIVTDKEKKWAKDELKRKGYNLKKKFISISPRASALNRSWRPNYKDELIKLLEKKYNPIFINRDQGYTLRQSIALLSQMDLVISADTGILHMAGALDKKIIALFGSFKPELRTKYFKDCHTICHTEEVCGSFCFNHTDECKKLGRKRVYPPCMEMTPKEVFNKVKEII